MRILLLNQFFVPDTAATGQLLADLAAALAARGHEVHVVCSAGRYAGGKVAGVEQSREKSAPETGRPGGGDSAGSGSSSGSLSTKFTTKSAEGHAPVSAWIAHRLPALGLGRDSAAGRLADWLLFHLLAALRALTLPRFDVCVALTSPPFIAFVGVWLKRLRRTRLVLWSMDLWPDIAEALDAIRPGGFLSRCLRALAGWIYARADAIVSLGEHMTARLCARGAAAARIVEVPNWAPDEERFTATASEQKEIGRKKPQEGQDSSRQHSTFDIQHSTFSSPPPSTRPFTLMYAGNLGAPHEFETILDAAERLKAEPIEFVFVGGGVRKAEVEAGVRRRGLARVRFEPPAPLDNLPALLQAADAHLISMQPGVEGCLVSSKIYGILAAGRPAILVGSTRNEIADLLARSGAGYAVPRGAADELAARIRELQAGPETARQMGEAGRRYYFERLGRARSLTKLVDLITKG